MQITMLNLVNKYNRLSLTVKASIWFTICNLILKGISFITVPIFSRMLASSEYGVLSVYMSFEQIILTLATWEIALSAYQKGLFKYKENLDLFTTSTLLFSNIITVLFFLGVFILFPWFNCFTGLSQENTIWLFLYMMTQPAYSCWLIKLRTDSEYIKATFTTILYGIITVIVPLIAIVQISKTADVKFKYTMICSVIFFLIFYFKSFHFDQIKSKRREIKEQWKFLALFQIPIVVHALSYIVLAQADRIMIEKFVGPSQAGFYSVAYSIASAVAVFQYSINQAIVPWRFEKLEQNKYSDIRKTTAPLLTSIGLIILIFIFISPEIVRLMFTEEYYDAIWCMPPITLSVYFMFLYTLFVWIENYYERTEYVAKVSVFCAVLNIILNYFLIDVFGYIVCGYTTLFCYVVFCFGHYYYMRKTLNEYRIKDSIYDIRSCVVVSLVLVIGMLVATMLFNKPLIRFLIILCIIGLFLFKKKVITQSISEFKNRRTAMKNKDPD